MLKSSRTVSLLILVTAVIFGAWPAAAFAATQPRLGTALNFAVLAGSTITNTGPTVITGNLGLSPGSAVTGFPPGVVTGTKSVADAVALQAKNDLTTAYTDAATAPSTSNLTGQDLGGKNLTPGVYTFSSSAQLTGPLTLSGNGVFIFQIGSTLTTASNSVVLLAGGAQACAVYWQVGSSATLGSGTQFQGNLMALTSITMVTNSKRSSRPGHEPHHPADRHLHDAGGRGQPEPGGGGKRRPSKHWRTSHTARISVVAGGCRRGDRRPLDRP